MLTGLLFRSHHGRTESDEDTYRECEILNQRRTDVGNRNDAKKHRLSSFTIDGTVRDCNEDNNYPRASSNMALFNLSFKPIYLVSESLKHGTTTKLFSVPIVLYSCISSDDFSVKLVYGVEYPEPTVVWTPAPADIDMIHRKWLTADGKIILLPTS